MNGVNFLIAKGLDDPDLARDGVHLEVSAVLVWGYWRQQNHHRLEGGKRRKKEEKDEQKKKEKTWRRF